MTETRLVFPDDFTWGVAASAYQIEGAAQEDGKGPSIWDTFCQGPGNVRNQDTGNVACDHYHLFRQDVALMADLEVPAYRLSLSWPRILPAGSGTINERGLDFYDCLVDELLSRGIEPWITLFHWDYPQALQDQGGWLNPASPGWFDDYVRVVVDRLSDRVRNWMTLNEMQVFLKYGHVDAINAPGLKLSLADRLLASHHVLLAHGRAVSTIREAAKLTPWIGWAPVGVAAMPLTTHEADIAAAYQAMAAAPDTLWSNTWFNDPVFLGRYPEEGLQAFGSAMPDVSPADMATISAPLDYIGLNIYTGVIVRATAEGAFEIVPPAPGFPRTAFDWPILENSLYWGTKFHHDRYQVPLYITENGMANLDWVDLSGRVVDPQRIDFLTRYLSQLHRAIVTGVDVRGYFQWSFLDNFEWADGYNKRFGLVHVDYRTQKRIPKESAAWYREVIRTNGVTVKV